MKRPIESVEEFLAVNECSDLSYSNSSYGDMLRPELDPEKTLTENILYNCALFISKTPDGRVQCRRHANRSALDIWRHAKVYFPDISIYDIMEELSDYNSHRLESMVCSEINRRVFFWRIESPYPTYEDTFYDRYRQSWEDQKDEFGLTLADWKE